MQKSCDAGELDCSGPLKLVVVDQIDQSQGSFRLFDYGAASAPANEYYRYSYGFGATVPSQQIFAEAAPEPSEFKNYTSNTYPFAYSQGPIGLGFTLGPDAPPFSTSAESTYWHGKATTVANDWYDVKARRGVRAWRWDLRRRFDPAQAGSDVEVLILNTALEDCRRRPDSGRRNLREGRLRAVVRAPRQDPGRGHGAHRDGVPRGHAAADVLSPQTDFPRDASPYPLHPYADSV